MKHARYFKILQNLIRYLISKGSDQFKVYEDCPNCLIPDPTMVGGEENPRLLDTLKGSISEFILSEKTLKEIKTVFLKI